MFNEQVLKFYAAREKHDILHYTYIGLVLAGVSPEQATKMALEEAEKYGNT